MISFFTPFCDKEKEGGGRKKRDGTGKDQKAVRYRNQKKRK